MNGSSEQIWIAVQNQSGCWSCSWGNFISSLQEWEIPVTKHQNACQLHVFSSDLNAHINALSIVVAKQQTHIDQHAVILSLCNFSLRVVLQIVPWSTKYISDRQRDLFIVEKIFISMWFHISLEINNQETNTNIALIGPILMTAHQKC